MPGTKEQVGKCRSRVRVCNVEERSVGAGEDQGAEENTGASDNVSWVERGGDDDCPGQPLVPPRVGNRGGTR